MSPLPSCPFLHSSQSSLLISSSLPPPSSPFLHFPTPCPSLSSPLSPFPSPFLIYLFFLLLLLLLLLFLLLLLLVKHGCPSLTLFSVYPKRSRHLILDVTHQTWMWPTFSKCIPINLGCDPPSLNVTQQPPCLDDQHTMSHTNLHLEQEASSVTFQFPVWLNSFQCDFSVSSVIFQLPMLPNTTQSYSPTSSMSLQLPVWYNSFQWEHLRWKMKPTKVTVPLVEW